MQSRHKIFLVIGFIFFALGVILWWLFPHSDRVGERIVSQTPVPDTVKVYFSNSIVDPDVEQCDLVSYTRRTVIALEVPPSVDIEAEHIHDGELLYQALRELFGGPTEDEKKQGFYTSLPEGVHVQSVHIKARHAYIDMNDALQKDVAGSCRVTAIRAQIEKTALQFDSIEQVTLSVNGNSTEILQP